MSHVYFNEAGDIIKYSDEVQAAIRLLEPLLATGHMVVAPDDWARGNPHFMRLGTLRHHRRDAGREQ